MSAIFKIWNGTKKLFEHFEGSSGSNSSLRVRPCHYLDNVLIVAGVSQELAKHHNLVLEILFQVQSTSEQTGKAVNPFLSYEGSWSSFSYPNMSRDFPKWQLKICEGLHCPHWDILQQPFQCCLGPGGTWGGFSICLPLSIEWAAYGSESLCVCTN